MFIRSLVTALTDSKIPYCIVGGVAVNLHGVVRSTYNVDLVVALDATSLRALAEALRTLGLLPRAGVTLSDLSDPTVRHRLLVEQNLVAVAYFDPQDPVREVEVVLAPPLAASDLIRRAVPFRVGGTAVRIAALQDLMFIKRVSGRPQDADDVARLEHLRRVKRRRTRA